MTTMMNTLLPVLARISPLPTAILCILLAGGASTGCKPKPATNAGISPAAQASPFQTESQFIVSAIVSDLAEQITYATSRRVPGADGSIVTVSEKEGSPIDAPVFECQVRLGTNQSPLKTDVVVDGAIWSPAVYRAIAGEMARAAGLTPTEKAAAEDKALISKLTDMDPATIEKENQRLSVALESDFTNPELHEEAALLLGAFCLREHSGRFYEMRAPLSRITAHLAMASLLRGTHSWGINGRIAEAMLLTLIGVRAPAMERLEGFDAEDPALGPMVRALRVRNTGDYRPLAVRENRSPLESFCCFFAQADYASVASAWARLTDQERLTIDFVRAANELGYSVEMGHHLSEGAITVELEETAAIYELWHHEKLNRRDLAAALNQAPEGCFSTGADRKGRVRVIGWGQWAMFLQRHLCHAVQQDYWFLNGKLGVPDAAQKFAGQAGKQFGELWLYPFVSRMICSDATTYRQALDDASRVATETPQLVPTECWNWFGSKPKFAAMYRPLSPSRISEWHRHNPPPGTTYALGPRLTHPNLIERPDAVAFLEKLHDLAPYDCRISLLILGKKYNDQPTYEQAAAMLKEVLPYSVTALRAVAFTVHDKPAEYQKLMLRAAEIDPECFYDLANYAEAHISEDKGSEYLEKACALDPDTVRVSNRATWRVEYFLKKGQTEKARDIADAAAETYSATGLRAKGIFCERTGNPGEAFDWYSKIESRYNDPAPLMSFCIRHQVKTGDRRFEREVKRRLGKLFPNGIEKAALADFSGPPADGVLIQRENDLIKAVGLRAGDVIVGVYGIRVHDFHQYEYGRELKSTPELELIVWQGKGYRELKPKVPGHKFGVGFGSYVRR